MSAGSCPSCRLGVRDADPSPCLPSPNLVDSEARDSPSAECGRIVRPFADPLLQRSASVSIREDTWRSRHEALVVRCCSQALSEAVGGHEEARKRRRRRREETCLTELCRVSETLLGS